MAVSAHTAPEAVVSTNRAPEAAVSTNRAPEAAVSTNRAPEAAVSAYTAPAPAREPSQSAPVREPTESVLTDCSYVTFRERDAAMRAVSYLDSPSVIYENLMKWCVAR